MLKNKLFIIVLLMIIISYTIIGIELTNYYGSLEKLIIVFLKTILPTIIFLCLFFCVISLSGKYFMDFGYESSSLEYAKAVLMFIVTFFPALLVFILKYNFNPTSIQFFQVFFISSIISLILNILPFDFTGFGTDLETRNITGLMSVTFVSFGFFCISQFPLQIYSFWIILGVYILVLIIQLLIYMASAKFIYRKLAKN